MNYDYWEAQMEVIFNFNMLRMEVGLMCSSYLMIIKRGDSKVYKMINKFY